MHSAMNTWCGTVWFNGIRQPSSVGQQRIMCYAIFRARSVLSFYLFELDGRN